MIEVAFLVDILTLKEAYEYYSHMEELSSNLQNMYSSMFSTITYLKMIKFLNHETKIVFIGQYFNETKECRKKVEKVLDKQTDSTFIEVMRCIEGGVVGFIIILGIDEGSKYMKIPFYNLNAIQILTSMVIKRIEALK